jgi:eukaryotic-like serine/threonine-protein kinase
MTGQVYQLACPWHFRRPAAGVRSFIVALPSAPSQVIGRYGLFGEIASGGMATVHYGRMTGPGGFARTVAVKRLHPHYAKDPDFSAMLLDEARIAARIRHPNVVLTLDVVTEGLEMLLVMEYVHGVTLSHLVRTVAGKPVPVPIVAGILCGALYGLHAAHEAKSETGERLGVVHRDVSPQNILVGADGVPRVADFGIAKATGRLQTTRDGQLKGKAGYMSPEQIRGRPLDCRTDVYAAAVVLWEALCGRRLFTGDDPASVCNAVLESTVPAVSELRPDAAMLDAVLACGLARDPGRRFGSAHEMGVALEKAVRPASAREIGEWVEATAAETLRLQAREVAGIEAGGSGVSELSAGASGVVSVRTHDPDPGTTASHVSDVSVARARRRRAAIPVLLAAAVAILAVGVVGLRGVRGAGVAPDAPASVVAPVPPPPSPEPVEAPVVAAQDPAPPPAASASSAPTRPRRSAPGSLGPARPPGPPRAQPLDCSPPYTVDASGTRHWKKGC